LEHGTAVASQTARFEISNGLSGAFSSPTRLLPPAPGSPSRPATCWWTSASAEQFRFLIGDRDSKFTAAFDAVVAGADSIIRAPVRAPRANAIVERFIGTLRRECLDHMLIAGPRHLTLVLQEYIEHYNTHRPRRSLHQQPPTGATPPPFTAAVRPLRRDRLGGLVHEYLEYLQVA